MNGTTVLITGANAGLGFETARDLARTGAQIILVCRCQRKALDAVRRIAEDVPELNDRLQIEIADLSLLSSIRLLVERLKSSKVRIDVLINNVAILPPKKRCLTSEGLEVAFATNYLGPFYLTNLLVESGSLPTTSSCSKIINVSSDRHRRGWFDLNDISLNRSRYPAVDQLYANTKFMLNMWTCWLARNVNEFSVKVYGVEPGFVDSKFTRSHGWLSFLWNFHVSLNSLDTSFGQSRIVNLAREQVNHATGIYHKHSGVPHYVSDRVWDYECQEQLVKASWKIIEQITAQ